MAVPVYQGIRTCDDGRRRQPMRLMYPADEKSRYDIYDAIVTIVTNHCRPRADSRELDARKFLTRSLAELAGKFNEAHG